MAKSIEFDEYFDTWREFETHLRIECSLLLAVDTERFLSRRSRLLLTPYQAAQTRSDVTVILKEISENHELSAEGKCAST